MIMHCLSTSPKNGVELMDGVESMTRGWWRPTPGSIYPLLREMTERGLLKKLEDGRYELTQKGRSQAEAPFGHRRHGPRTMEDMVGQMQSFVSYAEDVKSSDSKEFDPHRDKLRDLAKKISDLVGEEEKH
jgi:DNA-binding PadR family transcriptional regulator